MSDQKIPVPQEVLDAFAMMWGLHPGPVMLIHSSLEIAAVNDAGREAGLPVGVACHSLYGFDSACPGCLAGRALRAGRGERVAALDKSRGVYMNAFWIPLKGHGDFFVHLGNDITALVRPELLEA